MGKLAAVYARVSTRDQNVEAQLSELSVYVEKRGFRLFREYVDHGFSGATDKRPALYELLRDARRRKFDVVVVTAFDRFGRSMRFLVDVLEEFHALGIDFISVRQQIDTTTPAGKVTYVVISALAEFEREIISERVRAGMKKARERGERIGRPPHPEELVLQVARLHKSGMSHGKIAERLGISRGAAAGIWRRWLSRKGNENDGPELTKNKGW